MTIFDKFPKKRPQLPPEYQPIFQKHYLENREGLSRGSFLTRKMESWMHCQVAGDVQGKEGDIPTLEIGAGTLNHLPYEPGVKLLDVVEPNDKLLNSFPDRMGRVRAHYRDIFEIKGDQAYQRIISIATFEHLTDLPDVVARAGCLLADGGSLRVAIPSEGCWPWKLGYSLTNGFEFLLRYGLDYGVIMRFEHVNKADEIEEALKHFFVKTRCSVFGLSRGLSFYRFYECREPVRARCEAFLKERAQDPNVREIKS